MADLSNTKPLQVGGLLGMDSTNYFNMTEDWRYSEQRLQAREQALKVLLAKFGHQTKGGAPVHSQKSIYECAHDWVSQGNISTSGIVKYYQAYYS